MAVVGADRIAGNGDVANKVGTYPLAVLAREHGVPFYVAAPVSTFDLSLPGGDAIRSYAHGVFGPVGFEGGFLAFQTQREHVDARAKVLVTRAGSVVGAALCQRDRRWPGGVHTLALFAHPNFADELGRLLRAVPLPRGVKVQAFIDRPSTARAAAMSSISGA